MSTPAHHLEKIEEVPRSGGRTVEHIKPVKKVSKITEHNEKEEEDFEVQRDHSRSNPKSNRDKTPNSMKPPSRDTPKS